MKELMQKSPITHHEMTSFLKEMRRTPSGTVAVSKLLAAKIQSPSEAQAIHAFDFLENALESETEGSIEFRTEIGRYRFLNEIIRILSPKYLGDKTPEAVKDRAMKFLEDAAGAKRKRWFPSEHSKVNSVYQSLIDGGIIQKPTKVADEEAELQKSIFERKENALILKRLLQSKNPSDLQAANRLIKDLVEEETRRNERRAELHSLIDRIETSTGLLTEMLNQVSIDKEIVDELVDTCRNLQQKLGGVATETNDEVTSLLQASENIETVLMLHDTKKDAIKQLPRESLDAAAQTAPEASAAKELSLADQLLLDLVDDKRSVASGSCSIGLQQFANKSGEDSGNLLLNLDIDCAPIPISQRPDLDLKKNSKPEPVEPFGEISKISREMMEQGLKGVPNSSQLKKTDKTPLSQIKLPSEEQEKPPTLLQQNPIIVPSLQPDPMSLLDLDFLEKPLLKSTNNSSSSSHLHNESENCPEQPKPNENLLLVLESEKPTTVENNHTNGNGTNNNKGNSQKISTTPNNGIANNQGSGFSLNTVRDLDLEKIDLIDDLKPLELQLEDSSKDVCLTLTFGKYSDFPDSVTVAVVTLTNRSKSNGLLNYVFQLLPPKGLQVKLLPPGCMELPPWKKTFLPPPILTQVALIFTSNSTAKSHIHSKIRYILSYCVDDETMLHNGDFAVPSCLFSQ
ncbi:ADP-ribosylation factor-binding protein GGA1 [Orchesella cincta]|uniref:ADP-ribosylation factor-binding protein GGA1 n=1 Tax=Orchesella cincta TaxID=48709 RepID=A0A1D2NH88_ORCCI|nr:ADP-ribosylation factor-binding protein GGA1 [Orchesella cincta]